MRAKNYTNVQVETDLCNSRSVIQTENTLLIRNHVQKGHELLNIFQNFFFNKLFLVCALNLPVSISSPMNYALGWHLKFKIYQI